LRAIAVLAVMLFHSPWAGRRLEGGFLGVDVFFALSGFLITSLLLEEHDTTGRISFRRFYMRRALRLLPALAPVVLVAGGAMIASDPSWRTIGFVASVAFYTANWAIVYGLPHGLLGHAWSLAIEERFYILWPPLLVVLLRIIRRRGVLLGLVMAAVALSVVYRFTLLESPSGMARIYVGADAHADPLLIGCALAIFCHVSWLRRSLTAHRVTNAVGVIGGVVLLGLFIGARYPDHYVHASASTWAAIATACVIVAAFEPTSWCAHTLRCPPLSWIGKRSYTLYLWHLPVFIIAGPIWRPGVGLGRIVLAWGVTVALAAASFCYLEKPALRFKATLAPSRLEPSRRSIARHPTLPPQLGR